MDNASSSSSSQLPFTPATQSDVVVMNSSNNTSHCLGSSIPLTDHNRTLFPLFEQWIQMGANTNTFQIIMSHVRQQQQHSSANNNNSDILSQFVQYLFSTRIMNQMVPPAAPQQQQQQQQSMNMVDNEPPKKKIKEQQQSSSSSSSTPQRTNTITQLHQRLQTVYQQLLRLQDTANNVNNNNNNNNANMDTTVNTAQQTQLIHQLLALQRQLDERRQQQQWQDEEEEYEDDEEDEDEEDENEEFYGEDEDDDDEDEYDDYGDEEEENEESSSLLSSSHQSGHKNIKKTIVDPLLSHSAISQWFPLFISNGDPQQYDMYSQLLRESRGVCGATWKPGQIAFKCRTCEKDPTCAICQSCFLNGDHEGHNYSLIRTSSGMCDCGDPDSWDTRGFCKHHRGPEQDPTEHLPSDYRSLVQSLFRGVARSLYEWTVLLPHMYPHVYRTNSGATTGGGGGMGASGGSASSSSGMGHRSYKRYRRAYDRVLNLLYPMIAECSKQSPAVKRFIMYALMEKDHIQLSPSSSASSSASASVSSSQSSDSDSSRTLLDYILSRYCELPLHTSQHYYQLFSACIADIEFKKFFAIEFSKYYSPILMNYYKYPPRQMSEKSHLSSITVQLFTVPPIAEMLVHQHGLLDILMQCLSDVCDMMLKDDEQRGSRRKVINVNHRRFQKQATWHLFYDLGYILMHNSISNHLILNDSNSGNWSKFLRFLSCFEHCVEVRRIDSDDNSWRNSVNFEYRMMPKLFRYITNGLDNLDNEKQPQEQMESKLSIAIAHIIRYLKQFFAIDDLQWKQSPNSRVQSSDKQIISFNTVNGPISFHIPLQKMLSCLLVPIVRHWNFDLRTLFSIRDTEQESNSNTSSSIHDNDSTIVLKLLEYPLRSCATIAMVRNRLWPRNNMHIHEQTYYYDQASWADYTLCQDLFLQQVCACLMDTDTLFTTTLDRYVPTNRLPSLFMLTVPQDMDKDDEQLMNVMELDYLHFMLTLWSDRSLSGLSREEACRKFVLHTLFKSKVGFNAIQESVPKQFRVGLDLESIVNDVADYHSPKQANEQGYFTVKKQFWSELDPYFIRYSPRQMNKIEENYRKLFHKDLVCTLPAPVKPFASMAPLSQLIHSSAFHRLLFTVLYRTVTNDNTAESLTIAALHGIILALDTMDYDLLDTNNSSNSNDKSGVLEPITVSKLYDISFPSQTNLLVNVHQPFHVVTLTTTEEQAPSAPTSRETTPTTSTSILSLLLTISSKRKGMSKEVDRLVNRAMKTLCNYDEQSKTIIDQHNATLGLDTTDKEREKKKKKAMARQKKIMASFAKKHDTLDESIFGAAASPDEDEQEQQREKSESDKKCAFCHENVSPSGSRHFAMISHICSSNTVGLVEAQNVHDELLEPTKQQPQQQEQAQKGGDQGANIDSEWWKLTTAPVGKYNELFCDVNSEKSIKMSCCSHVCHVDCFDSYFKSLANATHQFKGFNIINLGKKEFLCPVCGRLANSLCPITKQSTNATTASASTSEDTATTATQQEHTVMNVVATRLTANEQQESDESVLNIDWNGLSHSIEQSIESHELLNVRGYDLENGSTSSSTSTPTFSPKDTLLTFHRFTASLKLRLDSRYITSHSKHTDPSFMSSSIAFTLAAHEIAQRTIDAMDPKLLTSLKMNEQEQILTLIEATRAYHLLDHGTRQWSEESLKVLHGSMFANVDNIQVPNTNSGSTTATSSMSSLLGSALQLILSKNEQEETVILPFLSCDLFSLLVKLIVLKPDLIQWSQFNHLVQLFYLAHIVQSLIVIRYRYHMTMPTTATTAATGSDASNIEHAMQFVVQQLASLNLNASDLRHVLSHDAQQVSNGRQELHMLKSACLPFMRRVSLLTSILFKCPIPTVDADYDIDLLNEQERLVYEFDKLKRYLSMPDVNHILGQLSQPHTQCSITATKWINHLSETVQTAQEKKNVQLVNRLIPSHTTHPRQFHWIQLPKLYQTLYLKYYNAMCPNCGRKLQRPAMCLITGQLIWCRNCPCEQDIPESRAFGKCNRWAREHFCGVGFNLLIKSSSALLLRETRRTVLSPFYLDQHGESDIDLTRGCALYLNQSRMNSFIKHFVLGDWDQDTILLEETDGRWAVEL